MVHFLILPVYTYTTVSRVQVCEPLKTRPTPSIWLHTAGIKNKQSIANNIREVDKQSH